MAVEETMAYIFNIAAKSTKRIQCTSDFKIYVNDLFLDLRLRSYLSPSPKLADIQYYLSDGS